MAATGRLLGGGQTLEEWMAVKFAGVDLATVTTIRGAPRAVTGECVWCWIGGRRLGLSVEKKSPCTDSNRRRFYGFKF